MKIINMIILCRFYEMTQNRQVGHAMFMENFALSTLLGYGYKVAVLTEPIMKTQLQLGYNKNWKYRVVSYIAAFKIQFSRNYPSSSF